MRAVSAVFRIAALAVLLIVGVGMALALSGDVREAVPGRRFRAVRRRWLSWVVRVIGVRIERHGKALEEPALWVANHISWLDIPVIGSLAEVGFLSKAEVAHWPVIGFLARRSGTLFIERGRRGAADGAARLLGAHLRSGHSVLIFPEGRTTDGRDVRRFHGRLLGPAIEQDLPIQPVALRYRNDQGERCRATPFVDDIPLLTSVWRTLTAKRVVAEIHFLPAVRAADFPSRKALAEALETGVRAVVTR